MKNYCQIPTVGEVCTQRKIVLQKICQKINKSSFAEGGILMPQIVTRPRILHET